ncbi:MAG TPA: hypothetical protein VJC07_03045 [Candidatus Nanoarchaeia archaeon]|nr:hypothetical protein [Candidatus Nanoarchaeia archaeon]
MRYLYILLIGMFLIAGCEQADKQEITAEIPNETAEEEIVQEETAEELNTSYFLTEDQKTIRKLNSLYDFNNLALENCPDVIREYEKIYDEALRLEDRRDEEFEDAQDDLVLAESELRSAEQSGDKERIDDAEREYEDADDDFTDAEDAQEDAQDYTRKVYYTLREIEIECKRLAALKNKN